MQTHVDKNQENKSSAVANTVSQKKSDSKSAFQFVDKRPEAIVQRKLQEMANNYSAHQQQPIQNKENNTGLPDNLKSGIENLSGYSMDDVKVHYNSDKPAQLHALAYAQGTDIHLGPGQEKHLPHEAWHVVQQKQNRVKTTKTLHGGSSINDDQSLEGEADIMGNKAVQAMMSPTKILQKKKISSAVKQFFWTRWYEYDGENYTPRFVGLPSMTGWIKLPTQHDEKDVYVSISNIAKLPQMQDLERGVSQVREIIDQHTPLLSGITQRLGDQQQLVQELEAAQAQFVSVNKALGLYLGQTTTLLKILGSILGFGVAITGGVLISYVTLPMWLVGSVEGLSFIYGCGLLYHWSKSELLPNMAKVILLIANGLAMGTAIGLTAGPAIGYATGLTSTIPLQHIQFAAIPFALLIEYFIVVFIEKANALRKKHNRENGHDEEHED